MNFGNNTEEGAYHLSQPQTLIAPYLLPPNFGNIDDKGGLTLLQDANFLRIRIYLDLLQYSTLDQQAKDSNMMTRSIDEPNESMPKYHVDLLLSRNNLYELILNTNQSKKDVVLPQNTNGGLVKDVLKLLSHNK